MTVLQRPTEVDVRLADNGPGTSSNELAVLKKKEEVLKHRTGLGLWIVDVAMLQTAGSVQYDTDSTGATVTLRLPVDDELSCGFRSGSVSVFACSHRSVRDPESSVVTIARTAI
jgi:K+-sensing histidine kinase KdpD